MLSKTLFLLVSLAIVAGITAYSVSSPPVSIHQGQSSLNGIHQLIGGANCGTGEIRDIRLQGCTNAPCTLTQGQQYNLQVDFVPDGEFGTVYFKSIVLREHQIQTVTEDYHMQGVRLEPGIPYTLNYDFILPSGNFGGPDSELRVKVYQNLVKPLCLVVPATIV